MLILLSILILVHELGHFGAARALGIRVDRFGFGLPFGPILYETAWGKTKVCIHALLLGGYVAFPDDDPESDIPKDDPGRISNRKIWERAFVISAGVTANIILAYLIVLFVAWFSGGMPSGKYNIFVNGFQQDKTLSVYAIGMKPEDRIVSANGAIIDSPFKFIEIAQRSKKFDGYVSQARINEQINRLKQENPGILSKLSPDQIISKGVEIKLPASTSENVLTVGKDLIPRAGKYVPEGQKLTQNQEKLRNSLNNKNNYISDGQVSLTDLALATGDNAHPVNITVNRNGKNVSLSSAYPNEKGMIGIKLRSEEINIPVHNPVEALTASWNYLYTNVYYMLKGLAQVFTGQIPLSDLHGIVAITKVGSDIIEKKGLWDGLLLMALISMDLAIVNLLPIPALDGGHLMFLIIEKLRGRPLDEKIQENLAKYGFLFLIGLMLFIIFNDVFGLITNKI